MSEGEINAAERLMLVLFCLTFIGAAVSVGTVAVTAVWVGRLIYLGVTQWLA